MKILALHIFDRKTCDGSTIVDPLNYPENGKIDINNIFISR